MSVVNLLQRQIERRAELLCHSRNKGIPVGLGKSCFEPLSNGVQFMKSHYKLDSNHLEYSSLVAKIEWDETELQWALYVPSDENGWLPYPYLQRSGDLTAVIREIEKDPKSYFWSE
jgi:hypothetical protein